LTYNSIQMDTSTWLHRDVYHLMSVCDALSVCQLHSEPSLHLPTVQAVSSITFVFTMITQT
jgi:hypothetical protein